MKKFFLVSTLLLLWISHTGFALNNSTAAKTSKHTKSSLTSHTTAHATPKHAVVKKAPAKRKISAHKIHRASTKSSKTLHAKKQNKNIKPHHPPHNTPEVKSLPLMSEMSEESDLTEITDLAVTNAPIPMEETEEINPVQKAGFHFGWGRNNDAADKNGIEKRATAFAHKTVATLQYSTYKFGGNRFDMQHGVYMLDCSGYVDQLLNKTSPKAYSRLAQWSGSHKPNSEHYYNFFSRLANNGDSASWNAVENSQKLQPGDILVFRYKNSRGKSRGGHVMLVMNTPTGNANVVQVRVADSATTGHSSDTRGSHSGIGIGTLLLKINPKTGHPYAYAWRVDSPWNTHVSIAMGRPGTA